MKSHISITIERELVNELKRLSRQQRRSLSNLMELAALEYLRDKRVTRSIHTSSGTFRGSFSRKDTYENR
ncbi:ribbon-helix-helix protein, CopG family [Acidobacteria bacterium AH-259-L09]|nr:ribbon-helix-helix protein, CopG family [Acidobacteria bacterium AH-259-L09]